MAATTSEAHVGLRVRAWRERRRMTQLELALEAGVSTRHLSFIETGRSKPGRDVLLRVAEPLALPVRERNELLLAAGFAPAFPERALEDPELAPVRGAIDRILAAHEPFPAMVIDRRWDVVAANAPLQAMTDWIDDDLLAPPVNALRAGLHPRGLARWVVNLGEVRAYFFDRVQRQLALTADEELAALFAEVAAYPAPDHAPLAETEAAARQILTPLRVRTPAGDELSFLGTVATFGFAGEVTTSELSIESLFPADPATAEACRRLTEGGRP